MQYKNFGNMSCPIARSLERVGEWWSILILRDCLHGLTRFDEFTKSLGIAPSMLSRRLHGLVKTGLLARQKYSSRPTRYEYVLTQRGRDFQPVIASLLIWGNAQIAPGDRLTMFVNRETGLPADPVWIDRATGLPLSDPIFTVSEKGIDRMNPEGRAAS